MIFVLAFVLLAGCSLSVDTELDGLPCGDDGLCREGFVCQDGACVPGEPPPKVEPCGGCAAGFSCDETRGVCIADSCSTLRCPPGERCEWSSGVCRQILEPDTIGAACDEGGCLEGVCLLAATGEGTCSRQCEDDASCGEAAHCRRSSGSDAGFCLPDSFAYCQSDAGCADLGLGTSFTCTYFALDSELVGGCALPAAGAAAFGEPCDATLPCASGLCGADGLCTSACAGFSDLETCGELYECGRREFTVHLVKAQAHVCVERPVPQPRPTGACCEANEDCASQSCSDANYCDEGPMTCTASADCAAPLTCVDSRCVPASSCVTLLLTAGACCAIDEECASGFCLFDPADPTRRFCGDPLKQCAVAEDCASLPGTSCSLGGGTGRCVPKAGCTP